MFVRDQSKALGSIQQANEQSDLLFMQEEKKDKGMYSGKKLTKNQRPVTQALQHASFQESMFLSPPRAEIYHDVFEEEEKISDDDEDEQGDTMI